MQVHLTKVIYKLNTFKHQICKKNDTKKILAIELGEILQLHISIK